MKQLLHTFLLCGSLLALASCGTDSLLPAPDADGNTPGEPDARPLITITADMGAGTSTRTGHDDVTAEGVKVNWAEGDAFIIYSIDADGKKVGETVFTLVEGEAGKASAAFEGTKPVEGSSYAICYPANVKSEWKEWGEYGVYLSMLGQKQTGNNSTAHLSKYDPMRGHPVTEGDFSKISFTPDDTHQASGHRATLMRFDLTNIPLDLGTPERIVVSRLSTYSSNDFYTDVQVDGMLSSSAKVPTLALELENVTAAGRSITAYMMMDPFPMYGSGQLTITLEGSEKSYTFESPEFGDKEKMFERGMRYIASVNTWTEAVIKYDGTASAGTNFTGGEGTAASPYLISTAKDLAKLQADVNGGTSYADTYFKLTRNINIDMAEWTPIGTYDAPFQGHFDGCGRTISGKMEGTGKYLGFFGAISGAIITNLNVLATVKGTGTNNTFTGAIAGYAQSGATISCCANIGVISGYNRVGGIVGGTYSCLLTNCTNANSVTATSSTGFAGGIIGHGPETYIIGCGNTGSISANTVGGIVGSLYESPSNGTIYGCFNTGLIKVTNGGTQIGTIVGKKPYGRFYLDYCQYVYASGQTDSPFACYNDADSKYPKVDKRTTIAILNSTGVTILNEGITGWLRPNKTCFFFAPNSDTSKAPVIAFPASSGDIGNITDGGNALDSSN